MRIQLEINNLAKNKIDRRFLKAVARKTIGNSNSDFLKGKTISLSIAFVSKKEIKKLNKKYRKKNSATDVLAFAEYENRKQIKNISEKEIFLGELVLCYDDIKEYAQKKGLILRQELSQTFSHGILHLLGFHHGKKMFFIQNCCK